MINRTILNQLKYPDFVSWLTKDNSGIKRRKISQKRYSTCYGYIMRYSPNHHFADKRGFVKEHKLVWEAFNQACLLKWGKVHHKNGIRYDNRPNNLKARL